MKIETTVYRLKIKVLIYGRLPDSSELQMLEKAADTTYNDVIENSNGLNPSQRRGNIGGVDEYPGDSGVE